ncbi:MAG: SH3 domain-containing protein [Verrucomicrobiota bacterium]
MKKNCWLILGMLVATGAVAQNNTNNLPAIPAPILAPTPAPTTVAPVAAPAAEPVKKAEPVKHKKVAAPKKVALKEPTVALLPGAAEVTAPNLNVRGQAGLKGETIAHLKQGEVVAVLSQINLDKHETGEPAQWAKIALPASTHVWVHTKFIDSTNKTVVPKKLNLRAGPGENFSVLGVIEHGTAVKEITTKAGWTEIETPETACGFVAAMYLKQAASGTTVAANVPPSTETAPVPMVVPPPTLTPVPEAAPIVTEPASPAAPVSAPDVASGTPGQPVVVDQNGATVVDTNPPPPRIVTHEGVVKHVDSIIAPTSYVLFDPGTGKEINFLHTTAANLDISRYTGMRIVVTGEEGLQKRWSDTPVLLIQRIVVLETNASPKVYYPTPRQRH